MSVADEIRAQSLAHEYVKVIASMWRRIKELEDELDDLRRALLDKDAKVHPAREWEK